MFPTALSKGSSHFIEGRVDVAGSPPALSTQCAKSLHQDLDLNKNNQKEQCKEQYIVHTATHNWDFYLIFRGELLRGI